MRGERIARHVRGQGEAKARTSDSMRALAKLTQVVDGRPRIVSDPPLVVPVADVLAGQLDRKAIEAQMVDLIAGYRRTLAPNHRHLLDQLGP